MINPRELRIGNIIKIKDSEIIVSGINERGISPRGIDFIDARNFEGVPLTEEWLIRFGFEKRNYPKLKGFSKSDFEITFDPEINVFISDSNENDDWTGICLLHIKYVHQLQNLYFEITGEELTIQK